MNAAAYIRVSSASQNDATQRTAILRAAKARGDVIRDVETYADTMSGKKLTRPALERLRAAVRAGEVRKVYVFRLDRFTRSGARDLLGLVEEFQAHGCEIVTLEGLDVSGQGAEMALAALGCMAKWEREAIEERVKAARERVEAGGGKWGRPKRMKPAEVERAKALHAKGKSHRAIAMALRIPKATISRLLAPGPKVPPKSFRPGPLKSRAKKNGPPVGR